MAILSTSTLQRVKELSDDLLQRALDQQVHLAVTGLSRSGKTAFITSLVHQLIHHGQEHQLPFFEVVHQQRFIGAKRQPQAQLDVARFDYEQAIQGLTTEPYIWPKATTGISQLRLLVRYTSNDNWLKRRQSWQSLTIDITDYPGEWLLDIAMLAQDYEAWSEQMRELLEQPIRYQKAQAFFKKLKNLDMFAEADENLLAELSAEYTELLDYYRNQLGLSLIQPGRFILPGELEGAPILQFFPYPYLAQLDKNAYQNAKPDSMIGMLKARFIEYKNRVITPFFKQHFSQFDRQIVLADCLSALTAGEQSFLDLQQALNLILQSFNYGKNSLLSRLFAPKIDKILFAATKADHITAEYQPALVNLLDAMLQQAKQRIAFESVECRSMALAAIRATKQGKAQHNGQLLSVIQGRKLADNQIITLFPGEVPSHIPDQSFWQQHTFNFINFAPPCSTAHQRLAHIRMDQAMQFLLGDKLR